LAVVAIIVLLAGIIMGTATFANRKSLESKTRSQLHQFTLALELFKTDNGNYPITPSNAPRAYVISHDYTGDNITNVIYNDITLYQALTNYTSAGGKSAYYEFKPDQIQQITLGAGGTITTNVLVDPYGNYWGYFCTTNSAAGWTTNQFNSRSYDLWSFGLSATEPTNSLICNWRQQ
jgi:type II secretory pathway pseudopilin PulG